MLPRSINILSVPAWPRYYVSIPAGHSSCLLFEVLFDLIGITKPPLYRGASEGIVVLGVRTHCTFMLCVAARGGLPKGPLPLALPISPVFLSCRLGHVTGAMAERGHRRDGGVVSHIAGFFCGEWPGLVGQNLCSWYRGLASLCTWLGYRCRIITSPIMCEPKTSLEALATGPRFANQLSFGGAIAKILAQRPRVKLDIVHRCVVAQHNVWLKVTLVVTCPHLGSRHDQLSVHAITLLFGVGPSACRPLQLVFGGYGAYRGKPLCGAHCQGRQGFPRRQCNLPLRSAGSPSHAAALVHTKPPKQGRLHWARLHEGCMQRRLWEGRPSPIIGSHTPNTQGQAVGPGPGVSRQGHRQRNSRSCFFVLMFSAPRLGSGFIDFYRAPKRAGPLRTYKLEQCLPQVRRTNWMRSGW